MGNQPNVVKGWNCNWKTRHYNTYITYITYHLPLLNTDWFWRTDDYSGSPFSSSETKGYSKPKKWLQLARCILPSVSIVAQFSSVFDTRVASKWQIVVPVTATQLRKWRRKWRRDCWDWRRVRWEPRHLTLTDKKKF